MMKEIITCEVINTEDKKKMTITTEWLNDDVKIVLLTSEMTLLIGETTIPKLCEASRTKKTGEDALNEIRNELTAEDENIQFSLIGTRLTWQKNKIWRKGSVDMKPCKNIETLVAMNIVWLRSFSTSHKRTLQFEEEIEKLKNNTDELTTKINEMEKIKKIMEDSLYTRFLLLLNSKKRKIRELEEKLKSQKVNNNISKFDEKTDESDVEEEEKKLTSGKRLTEEISSSPVASTSKKMCKFSIKSSQESDDEIVLRYDESQTEYTTRLNIEESPEDDIFS